MTELKAFIKRVPFLREVVLFLLRARIVGAYLLDQVERTVKWLFSSRETANFTYRLTDLNKRYLASLVAFITGTQFEQIWLYLEELENNSDLRKHIQTSIQSSSEKYFADQTIHYGRRLGWYAIARAIKPKIIIETGVDKGMGSCVLTAALIQNTKEGCPGYYYGTDINRKAGYLLNGIYAKYGEVLYGDSIQSLETLDVSIDLFINDSDHSAEYEVREYATISNKLAENAVLLGDNAHVTSALLDFALATNREFVYFQEKPEAHWYPGAGIGIAFPRSLPETLDDIR